MASVLLLYLSLLHFWASYTFCRLVDGTCLKSDVQIDFADGIGKVNCAVSQGWECTSDVEKYVLPERPSPSPSIKAQPKS